MRNLAELRGPKAPFAVSRDGVITSVESKLKDLLEGAGYMVVDHRINIEPQHIARIEPTTKAPGMSS